MNTPTTARGAAVAAAVLSLVLAGCGSDSSTDSESSAAETTTSSSAESSGGPTRGLAEVIEAVRRAARIAPALQPAPRMLGFGLMPLLTPSGGSALESARARYPRGGHGARPGTASALSGIGASGRVDPPWVPL